MHSNAAFSLNEQVSFMKLSKIYTRTFNKPKRLQCDRYADITFSKLYKQPVKTFRFKNFSRHQIECCFGRTTTMLSDIKNIAIH